MKPVEHMIREVADFMQHPAAGQNKEPLEMTPEELTAMKRLRVRLIKEETIQELCDVIERTDPSNAEDREELLDGILDSLYVILGTAYAFRIHKHIGEGWRRVHENNLLKLTGSTIVNGKVVKSLNHPKVRLKDLV